MTTPSKFEIILETGRQRYEKRAGKPLDQSLAIRLKTVADLRKHIEDQNGMFEAFRNKDKIIYARLNTVFMPIERLGNCVVTPVSASSPPVGACFGAVAILIKSAQDVSTHYDRIVELFEIMGGVMDRFELHDIDRITPQLEENYANVLATVLEMIAIFTKAIERKRWKEYMLKILKGHDEQMAQLRKRLDQLVRDGTSLVVEQINSSVGRIEAQSTSTNVHMERIGNHTKHIGLDVLDIKDSSREIMDILLQQHSTKREDDLYDILKPTQTNTDRMEEISRQRVPDTGAWLLEEPAFQSWLHGSEPLLWICGSPGSGKTYLASSAITMLQARSAGAADGWRSTAAGFFFFNKSEVGCMIGGFHQALRDVAWQITRFNADYTDHVTSQCRSWADIETVPSAWRKLITSYFSKKGRTLYLVFDGIDEAEEGGDRGRAAFLKLLPDIIGKTLEREGPYRPNIRILLLGRPHLSNSIRIAAYGQQTRMVTISVEAHKNREDLRRYIERGVARLQLGGASTHLDKTIRDALEAKAQGMFLWVGLMLNVLEVQSTEQEILDCLNRAPTDIEGMIREVLKVYSSTLKGREAEEFNTILAWVSFAARPLTLAELDAVLRRSSPFGGAVLSLEAKLREKFGSFITLTRDDGLSTGMLQSRMRRSKEESAYDSKYETTSVGFTHASIMEYFQKGEGKFAARKTYPKIGVVYAEAHPYILKICFEVFLAPGEGDKKKSAKTLKTYSQDHWYDHLERSISQPFDATDQLELLRMLYSFLNNPGALRGWCEGTPWRFYTEKAVSVLWTCMQKWYDNSDVDAVLLDWVQNCSIKKAELVFLAAAKVYAEQGLHKDASGDDWLAQPAITAIAQIRALIEDDDTLDTLPDPPPLETLLKAVKWAGLEENAVWNRKLAVCLRNLNYVADSVPYFERALQLDETYVPARSGLATIYRKQGYFTKAIELESTNATYLVRQIKCSNGDIDALNQDLGYSYSLIAYCYGKLKDEAAALRYWRLAAELQAIVQYGVRIYLRLLCASPKEDRWKDIIWFSKLMEQAKDDVEDHSRLTTCLLDNPFPDESHNGVLQALARAAVAEGCLEWLENVYNTAILHSKDHGTVVYLKMSIVDLHLKFTKDLTRAELLIEELVEVACLDEESRIQQLEKCKSRLGQHFCRICVRKAVAAGLNSAEATKYINRLAKLCRSGLEPREPRSKCIYGERSAVYMALIQRRRGNVAEAGIIMRGWLVETCDLALHPRSSTDVIGLIGLGRALIAMGLYDEAISTLRVVHSRGKWVCKSCHRRLGCEEDAAICELCLEGSCGNCVFEPVSKNFCMSGHSFLSIPRTSTRDVPCCFSFKGETVSIHGLVEHIHREWCEVLG